MQRTTAAASPRPAAGMAVELTRRRVPLYLWILEIRRRTRATTSNVLKLADRCNELGASAPAVHSGRSCRCTLRWRTATTPNVCNGAAARAESARQHARDVRLHRCCSQRTVQRIARRCHEWTWDCVLPCATKRRTCGQLSCIVCAPWMYRASVREVFGES